MSEFTRSKKPKMTVKLSQNEFLTNVEDMYIEKRYAEAADLLENFSGLQNNPDALILLGNIYLVQNPSSEKALNLLLMADKLDPTKGMLKHSIGLIYYSMENYPEAILFFTGALNYEQKNIQYRMNLAICYEKAAEEQEEESEEQMEFFVKAREEYFEIMKSESNNTQILMNIGVIEAKMQNFESSLDYLKKARSLNPSDYRAYLNIGNVHIIQQSFSEAISCFKDALKFSKNNLNILKPYMIALSKLERWDELEEICKRVLKIDRKNAKAIGLLTRALKENNKFNDLEKLLGKINKKVDTYEKTHQHTPNADAIVREEMKKELRKLKKKIKEKLIEVKKTKLVHVRFDIPSMESDQLYSRRSNMPKEMSMKMEKIMMQNPNEYHHTLSRDKNNKEALFNLGLIYFKNEQYFESEECFLKLIQLDSHYNGEIAYERLGDIQYKKNKDLSAAKSYYEKGARVNANEVLFVKLGRCCEKLGDFEAAEREYKKSVEVNHMYLWGTFHLACLLSRLPEDQDRYVEAISLFKKCYEMDKDNPEILNRYCQELIKSRLNINVDNAIDILDKAKEHFSGNVEILITLSKAYETKGKMNLAINALEEANKYSDFYTNGNKLFLLGNIYEKNQNYSKAVQVYKNVLNFCKDHIPSVIHLATILSNGREYKRSLKYFKYAIKLDQNHLYAHYGIAKIFQAIKDFEMALKHYIICSQLDKNNYRTYLQMGIIHLDCVRYNNAREMFEKCLEITPSNVLGLTGLGNVYYEMGDFKKAETYHAKAYSLEPKEIQVVVAYANTMSSLQSYERAIDLYEIALKIDPMIPDIHQNLANAYYLIDRYDEAIYNYIKAIQKEQDKSGDVYYNLGNALCAKNLYREAIKCFKKSAKYDPENIEAVYNLGNAYFVCGDYKKAAKRYEDCLGKESDSKDMKFALARAYFEISSYDSLHKCENLLKELLKTDASNCNYLLYSGLICEKTNKRQDAIQHYKVSLILSFLI
jgi:tetratricopeptide (TPR) repeat protein